MNDNCTDSSRRFVAVGDMDKLGVCSECGGVTMWIAVEQTDGGHEIVPFCTDHRPETAAGNTGSSGQ